MLINTSLGYQRESWEAVLLEIAMVVDGTSSGSDLDQACL